MEKGEKLVNRGQSATSVVGIPLRGWIDILKRTWTQSQEDNVFLIAAGVAFYFLLALVPALTAFTAVGSLLVPLQAARDILNEVGNIMPESTQQLLVEQLDAAMSTERQPSALTYKVIFGLALSFWAAAAGVRAMMKAVTVAYREKEERALFEFHLTAFGLTFASIFIGICVIVAFVAVPLALSFLSFSGTNEILLLVLRWPIIIVAVTLGLSLTYRFAPSRRQAKIKWLSAGAVCSAIFWLLGSIAFTSYVEQFANYEALHGTLSSVVILLLWFWFSAVVALFGAELNAEIEHQTSTDTTIGRDRPMGERRAYVADHVA
ncbi:MAG: YihY/virulence factor BrkB family protein [Rhodobacteraceae bacterium]|nr:YihY/virulence factor BrkB family protein [Paracoccaceae bacterium]